MLIKKEPLLRDRADPSGLRELANRKMAACRADSLQARVKAAGRDCAKLAALRENEPDLKTDDARIKSIRSRLDASLAECRRAQEERERQQELAAQRQAEERKQRQEEQQRQAMADCPGIRPPEKAPQVVLVFDASGSMNFDVNMTHQQVLQVERHVMYRQLFTEALGQLLGVRGLGSLMSMVKNVPPERQRITAAREATRRLVQSLPSDVDTGLVLVNDCPSAYPVGFYAPANRSSLLAQINGIQARGGTPLGDGIRRAAAMVDGVNRDAVIVVLSDGEDSCGSNPCMVAQQIARSKPRLKINVVDIQSEGLAHCLAEATGGRFYSAHSADQIISVTREAGQDALTPAHCRKQ
jgi:Mg-chelatase subunit ChlD